MSLDAAFKAAIEDIMSQSARICSRYYSTLEDLGKLNELRTLLDEIANDLEESCTQRMLDGRAIQEAVNDPAGGGLPQ